MIHRMLRCLVLGLTTFSFSIFAAPTIDPMANVNIPAGKSLAIPVTATSPNGLPLTFTATSSTNRIAVQVRTNNPFWKMSVVQAAPPATPGAYQTPFRGSYQTVTNVGDMTFMLFRDVAPHAVDVIQGLTASGMYTSNTIFHRVIAGFMDQGGDPSTNGTGGPVFRYNDEWNPQTMFTGSGQLALANSGKDTDGSQFFVTVAPYRFGDFGYVIFGQLLRGFNVLSNINNTAVDANSRPLADVIITKASLVPDNFDTVLTLTGTNLAGVAGTIKVVASDGAGGLTTNSFTATTVADANLENPFLYPNVTTNLIGPVNKSLTNYVFGYDFPGVTNYWYVLYADANSSVSATNSFLNVVTNQLQMVVVPNTNYTGPVSFVFVVASFPYWNFYPLGLWFNSPGQYPYDSQTYTFAFGDTAISAAATNFVAPPLATFSNQLLASFTNGVPNSPTNNFSASINWGDNSISSGVILTNTLGRKEVRGSHTYTNSGDYPVYITIQSALGTSSTVVATSTVPPSLTLARSGTNNTIGWPAWAFVYQPWSNTNLAGTNWIAVTNASVLVGYQNVISNSSANSNLFFRLKH